MGSAMLLSSGCGTPIKYASSTMNETEVLNHQKAVAIVRVRHAERGYSDPEECHIPEYHSRRMHFTLSRVDDDYPNEETRLSYRSKPWVKHSMPILEFFDPLEKQAYDAFMLKPGLYVIEELFYPGRDQYDFMYYTMADGFKNLRGHLIAPYGWFRVKPGDIVYLGDIYYKMADMNLLAEQIKFQRNVHPTGGLITVFDEYEKAVQYFKNKYPQLSNKPIKKDLLKVNEEIR